MRDDFSSKTKDIMARRVAYLCSNPECNMLTIGPNSDPNNTINIGVAAHITAASIGGARYNPLLTPEKRGSLNNGIWLCYSCSKLIDSDIKKYTVKFLEKWKSEAEQNAGNLLNKQMSKGSSYVEAGDMKVIKENGYYEKEFGGQKVRYFLQGLFLHIEHEPAPGIIAYYVLDQNGDVIENKFPYDVSEYEIEINPDLILKETTELLPDNIIKKSYSLKWGNYAEIFFQNGKLGHFYIKNQATINHVQKKIWIKPPQFSG